MDSLDRAIDLISRWKADRQKQRKDVLTLLEGVKKECQTAMTVWQSFLDKPGEPGNQWTVMSWIGPDRAKQLHEINLRAKHHVENVCRLAGPAAGRFVVLDVDVLEMGYRQLNPGETGMQAAQSAISRTQQFEKYVEGLMSRVRNAKAAPAASGKKSVAKKSKAKRSKKPAKKKAAPQKK